MAEKIWVFIDHFQGTAIPASWEAVGAARSLAEHFESGVTAIVAGEEVKSLVDQAFQYGVAEVFYADAPALGDYRAEAYTNVVSQLAREYQPEVILFPTTSRGREVAGMVAIDLRTGVIPDAIDLQSQDGTIMVTRPVYAGKLLSKAVCIAKPQIITLRVRAFKPPEPQPGRSGKLTPVSVNLEEGSLLTRVFGYSESSGGVSLSDAAVIVSGGRGVSNNPNLIPPPGMDEKQAEIWRAQQGFNLITDLAQVLGAAVGASRAAVDAGYIPYAHQVGQTGKVVSPDLYIACGISGAIQHQAGMRTSKVIVAINKDPEAPIFKMARYGVIGDLFEVVPALTEALREKLRK